MQTALSPEDLHVYELDTAAGMGVPPAATLARWTRGTTGPLDPAQLAPAERVQFPTWDRADGQQRTIPAFVYRPRTPGPHPVLIDLHGGAESQHRPVWSSLRQYMIAKLGYAIVAPNVRGSSGYGRSFQSLDNGALREDSLRDIGALLAWIGLQPQFDRTRVVIASDAPGGYLTLASLVQYGDRLAGGINTAGIGIFADMQSIRKPLLIAQGLNDPRIPAGESAQMMSIARARGSEVWYLAAQDEGRSFLGKASSDAYGAVLAAFLKRLAAKQ
jgi:dipeptidyl aminopeptidase/acylaminoacyl peptidase